MCLFLSDRSAIQRLFLRLIAFITGFSVVDRIINHLELTFVASKPNPAQMASQELLIAAAHDVEYF